MSEQVTDILHRRPLPSFDQWLEENGNGERGDGFEAFVDLAKRTHAKEPVAGLTDDETSFLRMWMGMQIAIIELCNIENQRGRTPAEIMITTPRVLGAAAMYSFGSVVKENTPFRIVAKLLTEEFKFGAKESADQMEGHR